MIYKQLQKCLMDGVNLGIVPHVSLADEALVLCYLFVQFQNCNSGNMGHTKRVIKMFRLHPAVRDAEFN